MVGRLYICNENAKRNNPPYANEYYDMIMKENQKKQQILYKPLYKNLLSQTNKYVTDIETLLSKIKGLKDLSLLNSPILFNEQIK